MRHSRSQTIICTDKAAVGSSASQGSFYAHFTFFVAPQLKTPTSELKTHINTKRQKGLCRNQAFQFHQLASKVSGLFS